MAACTNVEVSTVLPAITGIDVQSTSADIQRVKPGDIVLVMPVSGTPDVTSLGFLGFCTTEGTVIVREFAVGAAYAGAIESCNYLILGQNDTCF